MTKLYLRSGFTVFLLLFLLPLLFSQQQSAEQRLRANKNVAEFTLSPSLKTPASIVFSNQSRLPLANARAVLQDLFALSGKNELRLLNRTEAKAGVVIEKYKQYFAGIRVEHSVYNVISKNGVMVGVTAEAYALDNAFSTAPQLSAEGAKSKALDFVSATKYAWEAIEEDKRLYPGNTYMLLQLETLRQQYTPKGELVIAKDLYGSKLARLAYKFDVFAVQPLGHYIIYVDAENGNILLRDAVIKHVDGEKGKPKPDSLKFLPNFQYYSLAAKGQLRYAPPKTSASVLGSGLTRYSGVREIYTTKITVPLLGTSDPNNPSLPLRYSGTEAQTPVQNRDVYILKDDTRGGGIETYDCNQVGGVPLNLPQIQAQATAFVDKDNNWKDEADQGVITQEDLIRGNPARDGSNGATEANNDDIAIDAHWGAGLVYDYWKQIHGRLSYDNKNSTIKSYVHYGPAYDNAFWNGSSMTYGDGSGTAVGGGFRPLVSLDVCGHEIGHGVCTFTSDLVYESESGAMNEGLSDIWAAAVERYAKLNVDNTLNYQYFQIGEQISADNIGLRRMDNPKAKTDPDTYGGRYWANPDCVPSLANDQCGVHTNSGVLNKWFYLMVQGPNTTTGSPGYTDDGIADRPRTTPAGTNWVENAGNNYGALSHFIGIGFDKAEQITYLMELSLTPNAKFADARAASILAAKVLYGPCSQEEITVTDAWYGVNVGAAWTTCTAPTLSVNLIDTTVSEGSGDCGSFTEYTIGVSLSAAQGTSTAVNFTVGGTAEPHDYQLSATSVTYSSGETGNKTIRLRIYNDDMVEGDETIVLNATSTAVGFNYSQTITILDDDVLPKIGNTFTLFSENFESVAEDNLPAGWDTANRTSPTGGLWNVRSAQPSSITWTTKRAYIYNPNAPLGTKASATYDINAASNVVLRTPLIDARGLDSIRLRFLFSAGGEGACSPACDYGEVVYSLDGVNFNRFDVDTTVEARTASEPLYLSFTDSTYNHLLPKIVSNQQFYLGFRWVNDDLATTSLASSITIDNIVVTGQGRKVESDSAAAVSTSVYVEAGAPVYFYSNDDKGLLSRIINASAALGCVKDTLIQTGNGTVPYTGGTRTRKVHEITPSQNGNATYTLTLYYTLAELAGFSVPPSQLRILKSNAADIDNSVGSNSVVITPSEVIDSSAQGFYGFTATISGFSKFAIVEPLLSPLPVNCVDFSASKGTNDVRLAWKTNGDAGVQYALERSEDGSNFKQLNTVASNSTNEYSFVDKAIAGLRGAYYRIKAVERSGAARYLCTVLYVGFDSRNLFVISNIYPNPGKSEASVNVTVGSTRKLRIEYLNAVGQLVATQQAQLPAGATRVGLQVQPLAAGSYLLQFKDEEGRLVQSQQFIKQ